MLPFQFHFRFRFDPPPTPGAAQGVVCPGYINSRGVRVIDFSTPANVSTRLGNLEAALDPAAPAAARATAIQLAFTQLRIDFDQDTLFETNMRRRKVAFRHFTSIAYHQWSCHIPASAALLGLAGIYDCRLAFIEILNRVRPDAIQRLVKGMDYHPFVTVDCLSVMVESAVQKCIDAQAIGTAAGSSASSALVAAHEVLAAYLQTQNRDLPNANTVGGNPINQLFGQLSQLFPMAVGINGDTSRHNGILTGLLLSAITRYGELEEKRKQTRKDRIRGVVGLALVAVNAIPLGQVVGIFTGAIGTLADPVVNLIWKSREFRGPVRRLRAEMEVAMRAAVPAMPGPFNVDDFFNQLRLTMGYCGMN